MQVCVAHHGVLGSYGASIVGVLAHSAYKRQLSQQPHSELTGKFHSTFTSEYIVALVRMLLRGKPCHILHKSEDRYIDLVAGKHRYTLAGICQGHLLGGTYHNNSGHGKSLHQSQMYVAGSGRHVDQKIVKLTPVSLFDKLLEGIRGHASTPQDRLIASTRNPMESSFTPYRSTGMIS